MSSVLCPYVQKRNWSSIPRTSRLGKFWRYTIQTIKAGKTLSVSNDSGVRPELHHVLPVAVVSSCKWQLWKLKLKVSCITANSSCSRGWIDWRMTCGWVGRWGKWFGGLCAWCHHSSQLINLLACCSSWSNQSVPEGVKCLSAETPAWCHCPSCESQGHA